MKKQCQRLISAAICATLVCSSMSAAYAAPVSVSQNSSELMDESVEGQITVDSIYQEQSQDTDEETVQNFENAEGETLWQTADGEYQVLETDEQNRQTLVRIEDLYITTLYDDDNGLTITYYADAPYQEGEQYIEKFSVQQIAENQFHSTYILTTENAQGTTVTEYNALDLPTREVTRDGKVTVNYYDGENLVKTISPYTGTAADDVHTTLYSYDDSGHLTQIKIPVHRSEDGTISYSICRYEYEDGHQTACETSVNKIGEPEQFARSEYEYDANGNKIKTTEYDTDGSVISIAQFYYDEDGNMLRQYTGLTDSLTINGLDEIVPGKDTDYAVTKYEYEDGRLVSTTNPQGYTETYQYGEDGLMCAKTDKNGNRHEYTYREGLYRASEKIYAKDNDSDIPDSERTYIQTTDANGNEDMLTAIKQDGAEVGYTYDKDGRVLSESDSYGNKILYQYDDMEHITSITVKDKNGALIGATKYQYDTDGRLKTVKDGDGFVIARYSYDAYGNLSEKEFNNESRITYNYNVAGWMTDIRAQDKDGKTIEDKSYIYTTCGNTADETDHLNHTNTEYTYDGSGRLLKEKRTETATKSAAEPLYLAYVYDEAGNRTAISDGQTIQKSTYDGANRLLSVGENKATYDKNGNMLSDGETTYTYDMRNQLISVRNADTDVQYEYDVNGRLTKRITNGNEELFIWADDTIIATLSEEKSTYYYKEPDSDIVAAAVDGQNSYYIEDNHGNIVASLDESGSVTDTEQYSAFGLPQTEDGQMEPGYTGNLYDSATGLLYLDARFYNTETGTFLTEDTVTGDTAETVTLNRYAYCKQNPVNYTDDSGHWGAADHARFTNAAINAQGYTGTAQTCMQYAQGLTDSYFHYETSVYQLVLSDNAENRLGIAELAGYCDQSRVDLKKKTKDNYFRSPYHGRGDYYKYMAYLLGIALQLKKGYTIKNLSLRNDDLIYQQMNFDMLIHLTGRYETDIKTNTAVSRKEISYLIMGIAMHLSEDLWAHTAVVTETVTEMNAYKQYFNRYEDLVTTLNANVTLSYLGLNGFADSSMRGTIEKEIIEGNTASANKRRDYAQSAATRLLSYYDKDTIMYSGSKTLQGADAPTSADKSMLNKLQCSNAQMVNQDIGYGRYICNTCEAGSTDSCYRVFYSDVGKKKGLGYNKLLKYQIKK